MAAKFWIGGTGTWDNTDDTHWSTSSGGANNTTHPVAGDTVTLDAASGGGTVTIGATITCTSITMGAFTGTLDVNGQTLNLSTFSGTGTGLRSLTFGAAAVNLTGTGSILDFTTMTNLTLSAASATFTCTVTSAVQRTIVFGAAASLGTVTISTNTGGGEVIFTTAGSTTMTIGTLNITTPCTIMLSGNSSRTYAITNGLTVTGTATNPVGFLPAASNSVPIISSANNGTFTYCAFHNITCQGGGTFSATNSFDLNGNTGITITPPSATGGGGKIFGG